MKRDFQRHLVLSIFSVGMKRKCNKVEINVFGDGSENVNMKPTQPMSHMYHIHIQLA